MEAYDDNFEQFSSFSSDNTNSAIGDSLGESDVDIEQYFRDVDPSEGSSSKHVHFSSTIEHMENASTEVDEDSEEAPEKAPEKAPEEDVPQGTSSETESSEAVVSEEESNSKNSMCSMESLVNLLIVLGGAYLIWKVVFQNKGETSVSATSVSSLPSVSDSVGSMGSTVGSTVEAAAEATTKAAAESVGQASSGAFKYLTGAPIKKGICILS